MSASPETVRIFDTTLRDGEQSPGATMTSAQKLEVARALARLGVDVIEAGFPAASPDDLLAVKCIAETVGRDSVAGRPSAEPPIVCGLARATKRDIELAWQAVSPAKHPRIHTFLATSPIHREHKLRMTREEVVARVREMVAYARSLCEDVEFSPEDGGRTEPEFLWEVLTAAIEAGATTLNIPDTVGYTTPDEFGELIAGIRDNVVGIEKAIISVHCHDDLGLATANSLAGIRNGARQVEVAVNGIGERAGNTALEEVVMALETRRDAFGFRTNVDTTQITRTSRLVSLCTGMLVQPNKAVVGANAFAHESGIHQDGMLKHAETYEIMRPETVGAGRTQLVLGKHSGRAAFSARLRELGYVLDVNALDEAFARFKALADRKKAVADADLEVLVGGQLAEQSGTWQLDALQVGCGTVGLSTASVRIKAPDGSLRTAAAIGTGPVDAAFKAIDSVVGAEVELLEYSVKAVTEGIDALGEVAVRIRAANPEPRLNPQNEATEPRAFHGHGADTDILVASTKAYLAALNRLVMARPVQAAEAERGSSAAELPNKMPTTLFEKIWQDHVVAEEPGHPAILYVDLHLVHEVTSPQAFAGLRARGLGVRRPERTFATMDHSTPTDPKRLAVVDEQGRAQLELLRKNCEEQGITLYPMGHERNGIVHVIGPELGLTQPGRTIVCGDSHTATHGAFGALAFGIGTSEVEHVLATQCLLQRKPKTYEVRVDGRLQRGVSAKDVILALCAKIGVGGGTGHVFEYRGEAIRALDMEGRMTVCNMSIEAGARAGLVAPDQTTFDYLAGRPFAPTGKDWDAAVERWKKLRTDDGATFDATVTIDASALEPRITFGTNPGQGIGIGEPVPSPDSVPSEQRGALEKALRYMALEPGKPLLGKKVDVVFIGSCTNSRISDLRAAASVFSGRKVASGVRTLVVPGSHEVKKQAEAEGLDKVFRDAGAEWREPGCSMCIAMNGDEIAAGQVAVSTSNRNFEGRQGKGGRTLLASPLTAAASAVTGVVTDVRKLLGGWTLWAIDSRSLRASSRSSPTTWTPIRSSPRVT